MLDWIEIGRVSDIPRLGSRIVTTAHGPIAVFRTGDDSVFALHNRCPHRGGPLSEGIVHGGKVTCPLPNWVIDLATGDATAPDTGCTPTVPVDIVDGMVRLRLEVGLKVIHG